MPNPLEGKHVALGVTGSIACYKAVDLASKLTQAGALVDVILTRGAANFLTPLTFGSITHRPVVENIFDPQSELSMDHVAVAGRADVVVVAPATAHTIAKIAWGLADDALSTVLMAVRRGTPVVLAPAMNTEMWFHPVVQRNLGWLGEMPRYRIVEPVDKRLACGDVGVGGLAGAEAILAAIVAACEESG